MNCLGLFFSIVFAVGASSVNAESLHLEGEPFHAAAPIEWAVSNGIPETLTVFRIAPNNFSGKVLSNAMALGGFKLIDKVRSPDKSVLRFEDNPERKYMTKFLELTPKQGSMRYSNGRAEGSPVHGVPTFNDVPGLALQILDRLGGDTNQISPALQPRIESTLTSYDKKSGRELGSIVSRRGIMMFRQIDGFQVTGRCFSVEFGNDTNIITLSLDWKNFQPNGQRKTFSEEQFIDLIKTGRAVKIPGTENPEDAKSYKITQATVIYDGKESEFVYPFVNLVVVANTGTNEVTFGLQCPVVAVEPETRKGTSK